MERLSREVTADVVRFRPRTNREVLAPVYRQGHESADLSAPGMAYSLLP
jgi:hypothetical protein